MLVDEAVTVADEEYFAREVRGNHGSDLMAILDQQSVDGKDIPRLEAISQQRGKPECLKGSVHVV